MRILLLGVGLQGRAALSDLVQSPEVDYVRAADLDVQRLKAYVDGLRTDKVQCVSADAGDNDDLRSLLTADIDLVIELLPSAFQRPVAELAVATGKHLVSTTYDDGLHVLDQRARRADVTLMPEIGLDPGLDLVLCRLAVDGLDEVGELYSYGAGIPDASAADNPLRYKVSWNFDDVLKAYNRPARVLRDNRAVDVPAPALLAPSSRHSVHVDGVGDLEAFPNADAVAYAERFGIRDQLRSTGRYSMRWPGHCDLLQSLIQLGLLSDDPIDLEGRAIVPRAFMREALGPKLQYAPHERDLAILRVDARGHKDGEPTQIVYELLDRRDPESGLFAMNRTVGFTVSVVAQMILRGDITRRGVASPTSDVPGEPLLAALGERGVEVTRSTRAPEA